ncbi:MAG: hypothetical protein MUC81_12995 [Bacteroidia bacterium]|jgi:lysozyme|nr:hypothetical protein [Bacteroidia bacterium]
MKKSLTPLLTLVVLSCLGLFINLVACTNRSHTNQNESDSTLNKPIAKQEDTLSPSPHHDIAKEHYGIDVSRWNGKELTEITAADSLTFVICKATQGTSSIDPDFKANLAIIKQKGLISGAYHFYQVGDNPETQANHFWNTLVAHGHVQLTPIVDIEQGSLPKSKVTIEKVQNDLMTFLNLIEQKSGRVPMIYTGAAFGEQYLNHANFAKYPLWLAEYTKREKPSIPTTWKKKGYKIWQRSDTYEISSTQTDFDLFYGTKGELLE